MRRILATMLVAAAFVAAGLAVSPAGAAPPDPTANKNALVFPVVCEGYNDGLPFFVWTPNGKPFVASGETGEVFTHLVGQPLGDVDVPLGVQKTPTQKGAFDRAVACVGPVGETFYVLPAGSS